MKCSQRGEIIDDLRRLGYLYNFDLVRNKLICLQTHMYFFTREFQVDEVYRFDQEPMGIDDYYLYTLRVPSGQAVRIFTAYPVSMLLAIIERTTAKLLPVS
jgi:hypothetical protein